MQKKISIGKSNFKSIIEDDCYFIDKSLLIKEFITNGADIILIPRPRRFGKTLNLSMLKSFFDINTKENSKILFKGLKIEKEEEFKYQGEFPVVFISFKDIEYDNYEDFLSSFRLLMSSTYNEYSYILDSNVLSEAEKRDFRDILERRGDVVLLSSALKQLSRDLYKYYNKEVILLIDEYDVPIQAGYINNYYDSMILFMRNLLRSVLKDNEYIKKAMLTGILRVAKESIFSGMNNVEVCTLLNESFSDKFGFTKKEIDKLMLDFNEAEQSGQIKLWYDGYVFGETIIYNPWSVLSYIKNKNEGFKPYWINSSSNALIKTLLSQGDEEVKIELQDLVKDRSVRKTIDDNIVMKEIDNSPQNIWSFLLLTGYLKYEKKELIEGKYICNLKIPNKEVAIYYSDMILKWFEDSITMRKYKAMLNSLMTGDIELFEGLFKEFVINNISYFDVSGKEPERVYHAFVLGMLISLEDKYEVKSNKESGYGRYDVMIIPKDRNKLGIIIEFKKIDDFMKETINEAGVKALKQIEDMKYETELVKAGINKILKLAVVFKGKEVSVIK